jgi:large subunit ribosomal protein L6e
VDVAGVDDEVLERVAKDEYWAREKKEKGEDEFFQEDGAAQVCPFGKYIKKLLTVRRRRRPIRGA